MNFQISMRSDVHHFNLSNKFFFKIAFTTDLSQCSFFFFFYTVCLAKWSCMFCEGVWCAHGVLAKLAVKHARRILVKRVVSVFKHQQNFNNLYIFAAHGLTGLSHKPIPPLYFSVLILLSVSPHLYQWRPPQHVAPVPPLQTARRYPVCRSPNARQAAGRMSAHPEKHRYG